MSHFQQTKTTYSNFPVGHSYETTGVETQNGAYSLPLSQTMAELAQLDLGISQYESNATYESHLSEEELFLLREKEALTKAVEAVRLRRQAVAAARLKAEEEVNKLAQEDEARRRRAIAEAMRRSEPQHQPLQPEEPIICAEFDDQSGITFETVREAAPRDDYPLAEGQTPSRLLERLRELALQERLRTEQPGSGAAIDRLPSAEPMSPRTKTFVETQEQASLEQRLRAEIEGMAAAQRQNVDAARAQVSILRNAQRAQTSISL